MDELDDQFAGPSGPSEDHIIHIRIQQRNGRKTITTVQGVPERETLFFALLEIETGL